MALTLRSVSSWERVTRADARPEYLAGRAAAHYRLAVAYRAQADKDRARPAFQAALDWQAKAAKAQPAERRYRSDLARVSGSVTNYLYVYEQDLGAAGKACGDTIAALQGLVGEDDSDPRDEEEYHLAYQTLYVIALQRGRPADALASVRAALPVAERLARRNPRNQTAQGRVALWQHQGLTLQREPADVESWAAKAIDTLVPLVRAAEPPRYEVWVYLLDCYSRRVEALDKLQRYAEALRDDDHRRALVESWPKAEVRRQAEFIQFWPDVEKHRRVDFVRERHRDRTRWQMTLGRFREAAQSADAAAKLATPADAWRDRLNAAEARARDGDVSAAYGVATALERDPNFDPVRALDQLTKIYDLHSDRYAANRKRNDDRIVQLLTLALQKTGAGDTAGRMRLHELRALRHTAGGRWDAAADDWEAALNLGDAARDARAGYFRERAAHTRSNAGRPTDAVALLEPLGTDVPDGQLFSLALAWARLTAHDKLPL
ncbi:MAG: hypothetical protein K2X84_11640, partial [Beijerinckiaceae bacterium]|nr:hypothetical protein [Beijerinckiaceae bacterium]